MSNSTTEELVVLVNEQNEVIGTTPKATVHTRETPLHRAFSCFVFNDVGEFLLQQRAFSKKTWPGVWSNSCCGHPVPNEKNEDAAKRRLQFELGLANFSYLREIAPYRYCFVRDGVMENEICPIVVAITNQEPILNYDEVESYKWISWQDFVQDTIKNPQNWSEWCIEETQILEKNPEFLVLKAKLGIE